MTELIEVDPATLIVGANVRTAAALDKAFVESIRTHGVQQAIQAYRDADGALVVVAGQRRTLAAVEVGRPLVKVELVDQPDDAKRIVDQLTENEHRAGMSNSDRMRAVEQLQLLGVPAGTIVKQTGYKRDVVKAALTAAGNKTVAAAVAEHDLDLVDTAAIAEFADDNKTMEYLLDVARRGENLKWAVQRARDDRERARAIQSGRDKLLAAGVKVLDERPDTYKGPIANLRDLTNAAGKRLNPPGHKRCPGHAAYVESTYGENPEPAITYVCLEFKKHGHITTRWRSDSSGNSPQAKADRAEVIKGNKDWRTATALRRSWICAFLSRPTPPPTAAGFIALSLTAESLIEGTPTKSAYTFLGYKDEPGFDNQAALLAHLQHASEKRALVFALGIVLGAYEDKLYGNEWRSTASWTSKKVTRYFRYLEALGYQLSEIELQACIVDTAQHIDTAAAASDTGGGASE